MVKIVKKSLIFIVLTALVLVLALSGCGKDSNIAATSVVNDTSSAITDVVVKSGADKVQIGELGAKSSVDKQITYYPGNGITIEYTTAEGDRLASFIDIAFDEGFDNAEKVCLRYQIGKSGMAIFKAEISEGTNIWLVGGVALLGAILVLAVLIAVILNFKKRSGVSKE